MGKRMRIWKWLCALALALVLLGGQGSTLAASAAELGGAAAEEGQPEGNGCRTADRIGQCIQIGL